MDPLLKEIRHNPMLWLLALVPVALIAAKLVPEPEKFSQLMDEEPDRAVAPHSGPARPPR